jgi:hypothetical protein
VFYTPQDTTIVTPNSDTPYSFVAMDLRTEPFVICNPDIERSRYFSVQLIDFYTFNFGYMGSRTTGNRAACGMIAGPSWKGEKPEGIVEVFQSETDFAIAAFRTQLFNPADIENVKRFRPATAPCRCRSSRTSLHRPPSWRSHGRRSTSSSPTPIPSPT